MKETIAAAGQHIGQSNQGLLYLYSLASGVTAVMGWLPDILAIATTVSALILIWVNIKGRRLKNRGAELDNILKESEIEHEAEGEPKLSRQQFSQLKSMIETLKKEE